MNTNMLSIGGHFILIVTLVVEAVQHKPDNWMDVIELLQ